jgi:glycosyltransferase involved in cell wall biosynthesis
MDPRTGGPCQGIRSLTRHAIELGHDVEVVCLDDPGSPFLALEGFTVHALGRGIGSWRYHSALRPWLRENLQRFDAVVLNGLWQYPGFALSQLVRRPNMPPYFVFPHGMLDPWFQKAPERRLKAVRNWFYWKLMEQHVIRRARAVFFTCAEEMRLAQHTFRPYQPQCQINVGYGVSLPPEFNQGMAAAFAQKCPGVNGRPYYLFLSRIHNKKGLDLLIKAYAAVCHQKSGFGRPPESSSPDSARSPIPCLVIAGPGLDTEYGLEMQKLAADLLPPNSVFWPGMLTGDAKWGALYRAEAFVLSSHQENFGIAVVEALACGTPVMISNQINIWRQIEDDNAGLVAEDTLEGAILLFRRWRNISPAGKAMMKDAAKASYVNRFGIASNARNLLANLEQELRRETPPLNGKVASAA